MSGMFDDSRPPALATIDIIGSKDHWGYRLNNQDVWLPGYTLEQAAWSGAKAAADSIMNPPADANEQPQELLY